MVTVQLSPLSIGQHSSVQRCRVNSKFGQKLPSFITARQPSSISLPRAHFAPHLSREILHTGTAAVPGAQWRMQAFHNTRNQKRSSPSIRNPLYQTTTYTSAVKTNWDWRRMNLIVYRTRKKKPVLKHLISNKSLSLATRTFPSHGNLRNYFGQMGHAVA
jgi:hypothetical protein